MELCKRLNTLTRIKFNRILDTIGHAVFFRKGNGDYEKKITIEGTSDSMSSLLDDCKDKVAFSENIRTLESVDDNEDDEDEIEDEMEEDDTLEDYEELDRMLRARRWEAMG
jgi:hypothetical protein